MNLDELNSDFFRIGELGNALAYWVATIRESSDVRVRSAKEMSLKLSAQADAEDQASVGDDDVWGHPDFTPAIVCPFAPVQFVQNWSPLPAAGLILGQPDWIDIDAETQFPAALAIWKKPKLLTQTISAPDEQIQAFVGRLLHLLKIAAAAEGGPSVVLVAKRGFSFDEEDRCLSDVAREALRTNGFRILDRSPF